MRLRHTRRLLLVSVSLMAAPAQARLVQTGFGDFYDGIALVALAGAVSAVFCLFALLSAQVATLQASWTRIAVRAVGSWIAAAGLLMLGWLARPLVVS